jgi:hypothetical protein
MGSRNGTRSIRKSWSTWFVQIVQASEELNAFVLELGLFHPLTAYVHMKDSNNQQIKLLRQLLCRDGGFKLVFQGKPVIIAVKNKEDIPYIHIV